MEGLALPCKPCMLSLNLHTWAGLGRPVSPVWTRVKSLDKLRQKYQTNFSDKSLGWTDCPSVLIKDVERSQVNYKESKVKVYILYCIGDSM